MLEHFSSTHEVLGSVTSTAREEKRGGERGREGGREEGRKIPAFASVLILRLYIFVEINSAL